MKHPEKKSFGLLAIITILAFADITNAATSTWGNAGIDWNTPGNWSAGVPTSGLGVAAVFNAAASIAPNISASTSVGQVNFSTTGSSGYTISSTDSSTTLSLTSYGSSGVVGNWAINAVNTSGINTISAPVILAPNLGGDTSRRISVFGQEAGGTLVLSGVVSDSGASGGIALHLANSSGAGRINFIGTNNSYTGGTVIAKGETVGVAFLGNAGANGSLGTGTISIGSSLSIAGNTNTSGILNYMGAGETSNKSIGFNYDATIDTTGATGALILNNITVGSTGSRTITLTGNTSGNEISNGIPNSAGSGTKLTKDGTGSWGIAGSSGYSGVTTVNAGTLLVNGTHTGGGAYTVNSGGTLGGTGTIGLATNANASVLSGGKLTASSLDALALTLSGTGVLNVSGALGGATSMFFTLGAPASTVISLTGGGLNIGTGALNFDDFSFTAGVGFTAGVYTLFGGANALTGSLGSSLTGDISGQSSTISLSGNDVILTVAAIPEPATWALLAAGLTVVVTFRRRHH